MGLSIEHNNGIKMLRPKIVLGGTAVDLNGLTRSSGKSSLPIVHTTEKQVYSSDEYLPAAWRIDGVK